MKLVAIYDFGAHQIGSPITDSEEIESIEASGLTHYVVRVPTPSSGFRMLSPNAATSSFTIAVEMLSGGATIDWGDGSEPTVTSGGVYSDTSLQITNAVSHDYSGHVGEAIVSVSGNVGRIQVYGAGITTVLEYGNFKHYLLFISDLTTAPNTLPETVDDMSGMFAFSSFNQDISGYDTSRVRKMKATFAGNHAFDQPIGIWDMGLVETIDFMFQDTQGFNQPLPWNTPNLLSAIATFTNAISFNQPIAFDLSHVVNLTSFLELATSFNQPLTLDLSSATNITNLVKGASSFNQPINLVTPNVTVMNFAFSDLSIFNAELNIDTSNALTMTGLLQGSTLFNQPLNIEAPSVTEISTMLKDCISFNSELVITAPNATSLSGLLRGCSVFNQSLSITAPSAINTSAMLYGCIAFNQPLDLLMGNVTTASSMLKDCTIFDQDLSGWCVSNLLTEPSEFSAGSSLTEEHKPVWGTCPV